MCNGGETAATCPNDCTAVAMCGNAQCEMDLGENSTNCPGDCGGGGGGTLDCNDQNVLLGCITCIALDMCTPPQTVEACNACLGGP